MSLISSPIPNFVNGVSQQPFTLRLSSQGELQQNGLSTVSAGLRKRPPTEHLAKIATTPLTSAFIHTINRDSTEQYKVVIEAGVLHVFTMAGVEVPVTFFNAEYLTTALPVDQSFAITTVADYSFIVNKTVKVLASTTLTPARPKEALVSVKLGNYGKTYTVLLNGTAAAAFSTPDGSAATQSPQLSTDYIAEQLRAALAAGGKNTAPWSTVRHGSVLHITNSSVDFKVATEDGFGGNAMVAVKGQLQKFSDLPANPRVNGFMVEIVGDQSSSFDNYWVKFDGGADDSTGVWKETVGPDLSVGFNPTTMPHQLVREADGSFTFRPAVWDTRKVGDEGSNPFPAFLGRTVNDVFFFKNRLGLLSDENYFQSETGFYFNCFRTTVTTLLDSDPVDVNAATNKVAVLDHAVSFNKDLLLFSKQQQFLVDSGELMTPKNVPLKPTTDFTVNTAAKPVAAGRNVYFTTDKGLWSSVKEFYVDPNNSTNDAADVSSHVPKYIPSGVVKIAACLNEDVLALLSKNDRKRLFIYRYYFSGNEKLQSSWSDFSFDAGGTILDIDFLGSVLYLIISRPTGVFFEKMDFSLGAAVAGEPYQVLLDRKVQVPKEALSFAAGRTTINPSALPYPPSDAESYTVIAHGGGTIKAGQLANVTFVAGATSFPGNFTASDISFGRRFMFRYRLSTLAIQTPSPGGGTRSDTAGRLQVRKVSFNHAETGYYQVKVQPEARPLGSYTFSGKILGESASEIGSQVLVTGSFRAPVMSQNTKASITLESDYPLPVSILSADWEGFYVKRSRSV